MVSIYIIAFIVAFAFQCWLLTTSLNIFKIAKAGNVEDFYGIYAIRQSIPKHFVKHNNEAIDISRFERLCVRGNSMKNYNINNNSIVLIEKFLDSDKFNINSYPVLVFNLDPKNKIIGKFDSRYKLRKFIGYIDGMAADGLYNKYKDRIDCPKEEFVKCITEKLSSIQDNKNRYVLSETYNERKGKNQYSVHKADSIYGKVRYAIY